jgi:hypothetical protein
VDFSRSVDESLASLAALVFRVVVPRMPQVVLTNYSRKHEMLLLK